MPHHLLSAAAAASIAAGAAAAAPAQRLPTDDEAPETSIAATLGPDAKAVVAGENRFSSDLYAAARTRSDNLLVSPASLSIALGLAYRGARGATAAEMRSVLHFPADPVPFSVANGAFARTLALEAPGRALRTANSLWIREGLPLDPAYLADVLANYDAGLNRADFARDAAAARRRINEWVEARTEHRIRNLLQPPDVPPQTAAVLVNAVYLKAAWAQPFDAAQTRPEPFSRLRGDKATARLMHQRGRFRVAAAGGVQAIALPYRGGELEMIVLLPRAARGLAPLERDLDAGSLREWAARLDRAYPVDTILTLPRFRLEWRSDLADTLRRMGLATALSDAADFSGMKQVAASSLDPDDWPVKIGAVIHKTFLEADEKGSEAAAATAVAMAVVVTGTRVRKPPPPPVVFRADRPFVFAIRDARTGAILFIGRLVDPTAG